MPASSAERKYHFTFGNREFEAAHLYELLEVGPDTEVLGTWSDRFCAGQPAITSRQVGQGRVVYVGTYLTPDLAEAIADVGRAWRLCFLNCLMEWRCRSARLRTDN
nr:beta-galactosidase trimerization domain-containing protein [Mesorhizobium silamurunense]